MLKSQQVLSQKLQSLLIEWQQMVIMLSHVAKTMVKLSLNGLERRSAASSWCLTTLPQIGILLPPKRFE